jgi:hypothetical protein
MKHSSCRLPPNRKAEPQRRVGGIASLNECTNNIKQPRYNLREAQANARRRCRLQRVLGGFATNNVLLSIQEHPSPSRNRSSQDLRIGWIRQ